MMTATAISAAPRAAERAGPRSPRLPPRSGGPPGRVLASLISLARRRSPVAGAPGPYRFGHPETRQERARTGPVAVAPGPIRVRHGSGRIDPRRTLYREIHATM